MRTTTESTVKFSPDLQARQDQGELIALATIFYDPGTDRLEYYFPENLTEQEAIAMLRRFKCFPKT